MSKDYINIPTTQVELQKQYLYGAIIDLLFRQEAGYPLLDKRIQTIINQVIGSNPLFNYQPEILSIVAFLETARIDSTQFRKCVLDAANLVDSLKGGVSNV